MMDPVRKSISPAIFPLLLLVIGLMLACNTPIAVESAPTPAATNTRAAPFATTQLPIATATSAPTPVATAPTSTTTSSTAVPEPTAVPAATAVPAPTATPSGPLPTVPPDRVELGVLIDPPDVGFVEVVGELTLSNGDATEVNRNDRINLIARPNDPSL